MKRLRSFFTPPAAPSAAMFAADECPLAIIVPVERTNLVTNPSFEFGTIGWTAVGTGAAITRVITQSYHGVYSLAITPGSDSFGGAYYETVSLTSGTTYAVSLKLLGTAGRSYRLTVATTAGSFLQTHEFLATGRWQWETLLYTETSTTTRRIYIVRGVPQPTAVFYIDGVQVEACAAGAVYPTTYIDGDQTGLITDQYPPAYRWTGVPHAATSVRSGATRAGGRVIPLSDFGFTVVSVAGLGLAQVEPQALPFSTLDGSEYQSTRKAGRTITIAGRFDGASPAEVLRQRGALAAVLDRDLVTPAQPARFVWQQPGGDIATFDAVYVGGLEGLVVNAPSVEVAITLQQYDPRIFRHDQGVIVQTIDAVYDELSLVKRDVFGQWTDITGGLLGTPPTNLIPVIYAVVEALDGRLYAGGEAADGHYLWTLAPGDIAWTEIALNGAVYALTFGADGTLYVGGDFTNAGGVANADYIATYDGSNWAALGTPPNDNVRAIVVTIEDRVYIGGEFTTVNGGGTPAVRLAQWNGATWSTIGGAEVQPGGSIVYALLYTPDGLLYVGGSFDEIYDGATIPSTAGAAQYNPVTDTWSAMGTGLAGSLPYIKQFALAKNGMIYVAGAFGGTGEATGFARWNGSRWEYLQLYGAESEPATTVAPFPDGSVWVGGIIADPAMGYFNLTIGGAVFQNGASWPFDIQNLGTVKSIPVGTGPPRTISYLYRLRDGSLIVALGLLDLDTYPIMTNLELPSSTTVTNTGTASAYPILTLHGRQALTRIYQIANGTTGVVVPFDLLLYENEIITIDFRPDKLTAVSSIRGNLSTTVFRVGAQVASFYVQPGPNIITFLATDTQLVSATTQRLSWTISLASIDDAMPSAGDAP